MKKIYLLFATALLLMVATIGLNAQSSNNTCASAITLTVGSSCEIGSIVTLNTNTSEPATTTGAGARSCWAFSNDDGVWYVFRATATALDLQLGDNGGTYSPMAGVYNGGAGASPVCPTNTATMVACKNYATGSAFLNMTGLTVNNWYYVLVDMPSNIAQSFCIQVTTPATNTTACTATTLTIDALSQVFSNSVAAGGTYPSCWASNTCAGGGSSNTLNTAWFTFTVPAGGGTYDINTTNGTLPNPANIALFGGTCGSLTELQCANSPGSGSANSMSGVALGTGTYFVMVDGICSQTGTFAINVTNTPPGSGTWATGCLTAGRIFPSTATCAMSGDAPSNNSSYSVSAADDGTLGDPSPSCWAAGSNACAQWFVFKATAATQNIEPESYNFSGKVIWEDGTLVGGADMAVFSGGCSGLTQVGCTTNVAANTGVFTATGLTVGQDYYVMMDNTGTAACTYGSVCVNSTVNTTTTTGNTCSGANALAINTPVIQNAFGATPDGTLCSGSTENNVWYTITSTTAGTYYLSLFGQQCNGSRGAQASIYNSTACPPSTGTCVAASNTQTLSGIYYTINMAASQTLLVNVDGFGGILCQWTATFSTLPPLAVMLNYFNGKNVNGTHRLFWEASVEDNLTGYDVEYSADGKEFTKVGYVKGKGSKDKSASYTYDYKSNSEVSYYRLKQSDAEGQLSYSETITLYNNKTKNTTSFTSSYYNPDNGSFMLGVTATEGTSVVRVFDVNGKMIKEMQYELNSGTNALEIKASELSSGMYFVSLETNNDMIKTKLVK